MFSKKDKETEKNLDTTLDGILQIYTSALDSFNESEEENNKKLYNYYSVSHIVRSCDYYERLEADETVKIIKREGKKVEYIQIGEYVKNVDENILEEIKNLEEHKERDKANFKIMETRCKGYLNELSDLESRFQKSSKSRDENLQYLLENGILELPRKKSVFHRLKNWFIKTFS